MKEAAIILIGLPGIGKGTHAFNLADRLSNFLHFDTGAEIYRRINDPAFASDQKVQEQKKIYEAGLLVSGTDPQWVADLVTERIHFYAKRGKGLIFSGSPRTLGEARIITPLLLEIYGKDRVLVLSLSTSEETARKRSLGRLVCPNRECRYPTTKEHRGELCPQCGTRFPSAKEQKSETWKISKIETRFKEFRERTLPALDYLRSLGLVEVIDAEGSEGEVSKRIMETVEQRLGT